jgi:hypothetical protein
MQLNVGRYVMTLCKASLILLAGMIWQHDAMAQGQDSTPAERNLLIMAELLPGIYDNANQSYFDKRRKLPDADRHARINVRIERVDAPAFGDHVFLWTHTVSDGDKVDVTRRLAVLEPGEAPEVVGMRHYFDPEGKLDPADPGRLQPADLQRSPGCDYAFRRRAGHFRGEQSEQACRFEWEGQPVHTSNTIELSADSLWFVDHKIHAESGQRITGVASGEPYWLERARVFHCYADIPGVGGGRDIPFERYEGFTLHDKGDIHWFDTRDEPPRRIGLMLQAVTWQILNEKDSGNFNRNSLVIYTMEKLPDGSTREHGYAFTEPGAERLGVNLKWMLVNCSVVARDQARPEL